jgi:hypothetical protein
MEYECTHFAPRTMLYGFSLFALILTYHALRVSAFYLTHYVLRFTFSLCSLPPHLHASLKN